MQRDQQNKYSVKELVEKKDELSLVMLINQLQSTRQFQGLKDNLPESYLKNVSKHLTAETLDIISRIVEVMLRHLCIPEKEVEEFTNKVKERKMGELFECFEDVDIPAARKAARAEGKAEGRNEILVQTVESAMQNFDLSLEEACKGLGIEVEDYQNAKTLKTSAKHAGSI